MDEKSLQDKVALVTGGGRGIGASTAAHLAKCGARVVIAARTERAVAKTAEAIQELGGSALPVACDVSQEEQVLRLFQEAKARYGPVDILVNNAGTLKIAPLHELSLEAWQETLAVNLTATFLCSRAALAQMRPRKTGVIVNIASVSGLSGVEKFPGLVAYAATKGGVLAFSEALAAEVKQDGIRVVSVSPGSVNTPMLASVAPEAAEAAMHPGQIGKVVAFLVSDEARAVNQTNVTVWGPVQ